MQDDKQLCGIRLKDVLEKRRLDQALNAKEFAVLAGISYSTAREWFHLPGFPVFRGVVFWQDFVEWRTGRNNFKGPGEKIQHPNEDKMASNLPPRAEQILREAAQ
jgi:hypothetical protein